MIFLKRTNWKLPLSDSDWDTEATAKPLVRNVWTKRRVGEGGKGGGGGGERERERENQETKQKKPMTTLTGKTKF